MDHITLPSSRDAAAARTFKLTPHESVTVREVRSDHLTVEVVYSPGGRPPPAHFHPAQDEHFEILAGRLHVVLDGQKKELGPGATCDVPRGTPHRMWNAGSDPVRAVWVTTPPKRTLEWFMALDGLQRTGRVGRDGMPGLLAFGVYLTAYRDVFCLAGPQWLLRPALAGLAVIGRLRGYQPPASRVLKSVREE
ncbi:cupin domain-containing protein [Bradyrhizobium embrapense]|uniref:cupin domain-containing protein n=1 Tax=Bradyrhizobium embrapense TaxID=630921 RepID=UPI00067B5E39|nr:cupin domain-containing protein [Bradyrhizobium embrapense]